MTAFALTESDVLPVSAKQAIGVFDSGSGGMVTAAFLWRMLQDVGLEASTVFCGDSKNLPYGKRSQGEVAAFLTRLSATSRERVPSSALPAIPPAPRGRAWER